MATPALRIRPAYPREIAVLIEFNRAMAQETEGRALDPSRLRAGVEAVFAEPSRGTYYLALQGEEPLGGLLVTSEWSDWRNGVFWWIQSVYVVPSARRQGVFGQLYRHVLERARANPEVCGLRLYVDHENHAAQAVYRQLGMHAARYRFFELDFVLAEDRSKSSAGTGKAHES
ncbi:MAG: GNAT family N-acetyltransferase [Planctomycetes bacterium]|nr:GNAT family N-acetyltransferase [Planctomycetota bacterium]